MLTPISISMNRYVNMIGPNMRITGSSLPVGVGVARVKERIERARMAFRETENFIVSSTLFIVSSWVLECTEPPTSVIAVSELPKIKVELLLSSLRGACLRHFFTLDIDTRILIRVGGRHGTCDYTGP